MIIYPSSADTNLKKFWVTCLLGEQFRRVHNYFGAKTLTDWEQYKPKWLTFGKIYLRKLNALHAEYHLLRDNLVKAKYGVNGWQILAGMSESERMVEYLNLFGDDSAVFKLLDSQLDVGAKIDQLEQLKRLDLKTLLDSTDPLEDWTTYTESDPNGVVSVAANTITVTSMVRGSACFVYADKGVGNFGATFQHLISCSWSALGVETEPNYWGVSNVTNPNHTTDPGIRTFASANGSRIYLERRDVTLSEDLTPADVIPLNTQRWMTIDKNATDTDEMVYSNSTRTTLLDTLTVTNTSTAYRYIHSIYTRSGTNTNATSGSVYDLDLQEAAAVVQGPRAFIIG